MAVWEKMELIPPPPRIILKTSRPPPSNLTQSNPIKLNSTRLNSAQLGSARLDSTQLNSFQLNSPQLIIPPLSPIRSVCNTLYYKPSAAGSWRRTLSGIIGAGSFNLALPQDCLGNNPLCHFPSSGYRPLSSTGSKPWATSIQLRSSSGLFRSCWAAVTSLAQPRPAPARPRPSRYPSSPAWANMRPAGHACSSSSPRENWPPKWRPPSAILAASPTFAPPSCTAASAMVGNAAKSKRAPTS